MAKLKDIIKTEAEFWQMAVDRKKFEERLSLVQVGFMDSEKSEYSICSKGEEWRNEDTITYLKKNFGNDDWMPFFGTLYESRSADGHGGRMKIKCVLRGWCGLPGNSKNLAIDRSEIGAYFTFTNADKWNHLKSVERIESAARVLFGEMYGDHLVKLGDTNNVMQRIYLPRAMTKEFQGRLLKELSDNYRS